jgi:heme/copper-type cytochrome/quinol oxidase subunit 1
VREKSSIAMKIKPRIELLFAVTGVVLFLVEYFIFSSAFDLNMHDTYFVLSPLHIAVYHLLFYLFFGSCYLIFHLIKRPLKRSFGLFHYFTTTTVVFLFTLTPFIVVSAPRRLNPDISESADLHIINLMVTISAILFLIAQAVFLYNILRSIFKKPSVVPEK